MGHILPLCLPSAIVRLALNLAVIILAAAGFRFPWAGVKTRPPMAEWGAMIAEGCPLFTISGGWPLFRVRQF